MICVAFGLGMWRFDIASYAILHEPFPHSSLMLGPQLQLLLDGNIDLLSCSVEPIMKSSEHTKSILEVKECNLKKSSKSFTSIVGVMF